MDVRALRRGEEEAFAKVAYAAFRIGALATGDVPHAHWLRAFTENPAVLGGDTFVVEDAGAIVGGAAALRFEMSLGGVDVPMRGIAAVVVAPHMRKRGVAGLAMRHTLSTLKERGEPITMLRPFRRSFYGRFGYGAVEAVELLRVAPSQLPDSPERTRVRPWDRERDFSLVRETYEVARKKNVRAAGMLARTEWWWQRRVLRLEQDVVVVDGASGIEGYAIYRVPPAPDYPLQECHVSELVALTPSAYRALVGFLHALGDQYRVVQLELPRGQALALGVEHGTIDLAEVGHKDHVAYAQSGNMARLLDLPRALALHPLPARRGARATLGLDLHDPLEKQPISYDVTFEPVAVVRAGTSAAERLELGVDRLAQVYFGAARAEDLRAAGLVRGSERAACELDEAIFGLETFAGPANHF